jgi:hypothetical protein
VAPPQVLPLSLVWISPGSAFVRALVCSRQSKLAMMNQSISLPPLGSKSSILSLHLGDASISFVRNLLELFCTQPLEVLLQTSDLSRYLTGSSNSLLPPGMWVSMCIILKFTLVISTRYSFIFMAMEVLIGFQNIRNIFLKKQQNGLISLVKDRMLGL